MPLAPGPHNWPSWRSARRSARVRFGALWCSRSAVAAGWRLAGCPLRARPWGWLPAARLGWLPCGLPGRSQALVRGRVISPVVALTGR
jgi:hypothetical protein